jgi:hypothetical protein
MRTKRRHTKRHHEAIQVDFANWYANAPTNNTPERLFRRHWFKFANTANYRAQHSTLHWIHAKTLLFPVTCSKY